MARTLVGTASTFLLFASLASAQNYQLVPGVVFDAALNLRLDLYLPLAATPPYPTVVWIHGGAWSGGTRAAQAQAAQLCPRGFAVAGIDYRLTGVARWPAQIHDCKGALRWLRANAAQYQLDPDRFGAWGSSAGGHLVAAVGTMGDVATATVGSHTVDLEGTTGGNLGHSSRVQAVVDWFGPTEFVRMREFPAAFDHDAPGSPESILIGGPIQDNPDRAATANPIWFLTPDDPPLLIMHGTDDTTVPFHQSELLWRAAGLGTGLDVQFFPVQNTGHGGPGFNQEIQRVFDFLDTRLRNLPAVTVSAVASDAAASEAGDPGTFTIARSGSTALPLVVGFWLSGSAAVGSDYALVPTLATIPAGQSSVGVLLQPVQDILVEGSEAVALTLAAATGYRLDAARTRAVVTIADDESAAGLPAVTVTASDRRAGETPGDPGAFTVTRTGSTAAPLTVHYRVTGSARNGVDCAFLPGIVTIATGSAIATIPVAPVDDQELESGEWTALTLLSGPDYAIGSGSEASVVLVDNDRNGAVPIVSVLTTDLSADEAGTDTGLITVTRTGSTTAALNVPIALGGRANAGSDYGATATTQVTIPAGAAWTRVVVTGIQDLVIEGPETLRLGVLPGTGRQLASQAADELVLRDDDATAPPPAPTRLVLGPLARGGTLLASLASGPPTGAWLLWVAAEPAWLPLTGIGVWQLDFATALPLLSGGFDAAGAAVSSLIVPDDAALLGSRLWFQALAVSPALVPELTSSVVRRIE